MNSFKQVIRYLPIVSELSKFRITLFVTLTTIFGYICYSGTIDSAALGTAVGIFLLACGSAVLNHLQEIKTDSLMNRTKRRPLVTGSISGRQALTLAVSYVLSASILLIIFGGYKAYLLGLLSLFAYNAIYTPLKRKSFSAIIPGAIIGALPPAAGWVAAGGALTDPQLLMITFFFFIWQIPHFWLLLLFLQKDYENAGFPTMFKHFSQNQVARITYIWTAATGACGMLLPLFSLLTSPFLVGLVCVLFIWLLYRSSVLLKTEIERVQFKLIFREINIYVLGVVLLVSIDKLTIIF